MTHRTKCRDEKFSRYAQNGFTLVELIVTLAIAAILMTQVVPSFQESIKDSYLTTETNKLVADVNLARSEAIKRGINVVVCSSANSNAGTPTCNDSTDWSTGWLVYSDDTAGGGYAAASNDTLIRIGHAIILRIQLYR